MLITISSGLALGAIIYVNSMGGIDIHHVKNVVDTLESWRDTLSGWSQGLGIVITTLLVLALIYMSYRTGKKTVENRWNEAFNTEFMRLLELKEHGELEQLEPDESMQAIMARIVEHDAVLKEISDDNPEVAERVEAELAELVRYLQFLDIERRVNVTIAPDEDIEIPRWMKVVRPFVSRGTLNTATSGAAVLSILITLLLIPSFFAIAAPVINETAGERLVEMRGRLEELQVIANLEDADREWAGIVSTPSTIGDALPNWDDEDQSIADALAAEFESNVIDTRFYGHSTQSLTNAALRSFTRQRILQARAKVDGGKVNAVASASSSRQRAATDLHLISPEQRVPRTDAGRKFSVNLQQIAGREPEKWQSISRKARDYFQSFKEVPAPRQLRGMLISNSLGNLSGAVNVDSGLGKIGVELVGDLPKDVAGKIYEAESKRFMAKMITEPNLGAAINAMGGVEVDLLQPSKVEEFSRAYRSMPNNKRLSETWVAHPPSYQRTASPLTYTENAAKTLDHYASVVGRESLRTGGTDVLASFEDYFPGYDGADRKTTQAKVQSRYNPSSSKPSFPANSKLRASTVRARSFHRLRGFSRVGGVLIGRPPLEHDSILPATDLRWEGVDGDSRLALTIVREGHSDIDLGLFDPELIGLALAYSADGRPTTVTMVTAAPLTELKILIHPTLEDTGIGCLATRLDQMVDETTSGQVFLKELRDRTLRTIEKQHAFYSFSWAVRAKFLSSGDSKPSTLMLKQIGLDEMITRVVQEKLLSNFELANQALASPSDERKFMHIKSAFYDADLLASMEACVESTDLDSYLSCLTSKIEPLADSYDEQLRWAAPPPEYQPWSGVREAGYSLHESFDFARWTPETNRFPIEFTYQLAFTTPPFLVQSSKPWYVDDNESRKSYSDINPWEFTSYKEQINEAILKKYHGDAEYRRILSDMSNFVILQRIFRLALDGKFGEEFQVANLAKLSEIVASSIRPSATRRWLSRAGQIEAIFVGRANQLLENVPNKDETKKVLSACSHLVESTGDPLKIAALLPEKWNQNCRLDASYAGKDLAQFSQQVSLMRQLRFDMGVVAEDAAWKGRIGCPAVIH